MKFNPTHTLLNSLFLTALVAVVLFASAPRAEASFLGDVGNFFNPSGFGVPTFSNPLDVFTSLPMDPVVETKGVSSVTHESADIHGYVNPNGSPETWSFFEWGPTAGLGFTTGTLAIPVSSDTDYTLTGLTPSTTYFYRTVGKNSIYTERGPINSFTTLAAPVALPPVVLPVAPLAVTSCTAAPAAPLTGNTVTWSAVITGGTGVNTYLWSGTDGLTGTGATASMVYALVGVKNATITVTSGAQVVAFACTPVTVANNPSPATLTASVSPSPSTTGIGGVIAWTVTPAGGVGGYTYSWTGTDGLVGTTQTVSKGYYNPGTVTGTVTVTSGTQTVTVGANATVTSAPVIVNTGGGGGGGINQPNVVLADTRQVPSSSLASAAFVYLNQVPYTGIEDYLNAIFFIAGLSILSVVSAWYFVFKKG